MERNDLKSLYDLLAEGYTVAQLATAVEAHGIHGWDRYGRFGQHKRNSNAASQALDELAEFHRREMDFWQSMSESKVEDDGDFATLLANSPLQVVGDIQTLAIHRLGWRPDKMPPIDRSETYPRPPRVQPHDADPKYLLRIIGALLDYLATRPRPHSQAEVIRMILACHPNVSGLGESTLEKWFAAGNSALKDAE